MKPFSYFKTQLKHLRWKIRRARAAYVWGKDYANSLAAVVGNAMPKSGSHLIIQVLQGLLPLAPFVNPGFPPLNRNEDNEKLSDEVVLSNIKRLKSGDIAYAYLQAREPFLSLFNGNTKENTKRLMVFVYRDPRDFIISHVFYAAEMHKGHGMHRYYTNKLSSMEERINAAITGVEENIEQTDSALSSVKNKYEKYLGWLAQPEVLCLRFEDLILQREKTLNRLLAYLISHGLRLTVSAEEAVQVLSRAISPKSSGTFRRAKPGNWVEYFTEANKNLFKKHCGDLLIELGYEKDNHW